MRSRPTKLKAQFFIEPGEPPRVFVVGRFKKFGRPFLSNHRAGGQHFWRLAGLGQSRRDFGFDTIDEQATTYC